MEGVKDAAKLLKDNFEALKAVAEALNAKGHLHHDEIAELIEANPPVPQSGATSSASPSTQSSTGSTSAQAATDETNDNKPEDSNEEGLFKSVEQSSSTERVVEEEEKR